MDGTGAWVAFTRYRGRLGWVIVGLLLFAAGWQLGRVMSPYYAAHPITFSETVLSPDTSPGSPEALQQLRERGVALRATPDAAAAPQVAGEISSPIPTLATPAIGTKLFVASVNSDKYHYKDCPAVRQIKEENKVWFGSAKEAETAGYTASQCTQDRAGR